MTHVKCVSNNSCDVWVRAHMSESCLGMQLAVTHRVMTHVICVSHVSCEWVIFQWDVTEWVLSQPGTEWVLSRLDKSESWLMWYVWITTHCHWVMSRRAISGYTSDALWGGLYFWRAFRRRVHSVSFPPILIATITHSYTSYETYGVATISRMLKYIGLFCKRTLQKRPVFCKETCIFKHPTHRSHPITRS